MRRPNHASRAAASTVVGGGRTAASRSPPLDGTMRGELTMRPEAGSPAPAAGSLEALEHEVLQLRKAFEDEKNEVAQMQESMKELFMRNNCEEYLSQLEKRIQVIENKAVETVHWRILDAEKLRVSYPKGKYIASPEFSACGLSGFRLHLYPKGDDFAEEGYCSIYFHVPAETLVQRTLFVGRRKHGPVEADSIKNCGVSEIAVLGNEIDKQTGSIIVGVDGLQVISSPGTVESRTKLQLTSQ